MIDHSPDCDSLDVNPEGITKPCNCGARVVAPWTEAEVNALNRYQKSGWHPYTCGTVGCTAPLRWHGREIGRVSPTLVAMRAGWVCPVCGYAQDWAYAQSMTLPPLLPRDLEP